VEKGRLVFSQDFLTDIQKLKDKVQDREYAVELYAAMCNIGWQHYRELNNIFGTSWRTAGHIVADLRGQGEVYTDFYCSGGEGQVTRRIEKDLNQFGWFSYKDLYEDNE
jgi:hypothetical protein